MENEEALGGVFGLSELQRLRVDNPQALFRHLHFVQRSFLFGVEDHREQSVEGWGGECRLLLNRNLSLHLVPALSTGMPSLEELPQFCVLPSEGRSDQAVDTKFTLEDGQEVKGVVFYVEPEEYDCFRRDAFGVLEDYPGWDLIPDSYYLDTELVRFIARVVLEHPTVRAEREYDFRLGLVGGKGPPPLEEEEEFLSAEELIARERGDDEDPPLEGMRSHPVEFG